MKQKVVIKLSISDKKKGRSKAMKIAVSVSEVDSVALKGADEIEVVGDGVDAADLTASLRKNLGYAELVSVSEAGGGSDQKEPDEKKEEPTTTAVAWPTYTYGGVQPLCIYQVPIHEPSCSIL